MVIGYNVVARWAEGNQVIATFVTEEKANACKSSYDGNLDKQKAELGGVPYHGICVCPIGAEE